MNLGLNQVKRILDSQIKTGYYSGNEMSFFRYSKIYLTANENIKEALKFVDFKNKESVLTVMASGDHPFNFISHGITKVDTFDINALTEYYALGFKMAMIQKYNYYDYLNTIRKLFSPLTSLNELTTILEDLLPYMDTKYKKFWQEIINYNYISQKENYDSLNLFNMLSYHFENAFENSNHYLESEENYNNFKSNLNKTHLSFKRVDARKLDKYFKGQYDFIYLSNILDYVCDYDYHGWNYNYLQNFFRKLHKLTNNEGNILTTSFNSNKTNLWRGSNVTAEELIKNEEIYNIPSAMDPIFIKDRLILSRKKNYNENID